MLSKSIVRCLGSLWCWKVGAMIALPRLTEEAIGAIDKVRHTSGGCARSPGSSRIGHPHV